MPGFVYRNPADYTQAPYVTGNINDPNIPAGWVFCWSDGGVDVEQQTHVAGVNSGGYPQFTGDPVQIAHQPRWPNGILTGG